MNKKTQELSIIEKSIPPIITRAEELQIIDKTTLVEATEFLTKANQYLDAVIEYKEKKTKPLNQALKIIRAETKPIEVALETAIELTRKKMTKYQTEAVKTKQDAEAKIVERVGEGKGKLKVETAVKKLGELETIEKVIGVEDGAVQFRTVPKLVIEDESLLPREYLVPDERKIKDALKGGIVIPGVKMVDEQVPYNLR